jgi:hypothetical protein
VTEREPEGDVTLLKEEDLTMASLVICPAANDNYERERENNPATQKKIEIERKESP